MSGAVGKEQHEVVPWIWDRLFGCLSQFMNEPDARWMNVAGSRQEVTKNALDHSGHLACPLGDWLGHLVHDGRIHSPSPGHRDRGGADQCHPGTKGAVAAQGGFSAAESGRKETR